MVLYSGAVGAIAIKCPECGAGLRVDDAAPTARCEYCGTTSQVRRRTRVLQIPMQVPELPGGVRYPIATQRHTRGWVTGLALSGVLAGVVAPLAGFLASRNQLGAVQRQLERPQWDGVSRLITTDLDGDGVHDIIGRVETIQPEHVAAIGAFDGRTGKRMWVSETIGLRSDVFQGPMALAGDVVVVGDGGAGLRAYAARDGSARWNIRLNEKVELLCAGAADGQVLVRTADERLHPIALADGAVQPSVAAKDQACRLLPSDAMRGDAPHRQHWAWHNEFRDLVPRGGLDGMDADEAVHHVPSGVVIALGHKQPGSRIPMIARYTGKGGDVKALWIATVPGGDPLQAYESDPEPEHVDLNEDVVVVGYQTKRTHEYRVTAFAMADGARLWDVALPGTAPLASVNASPTHALVSRWDGLYVYDLRTGEPTYTIR